MPEGNQSMYPDWKVKGKAKPGEQILDRQWRKKPAAFIEPCCRGYFTETGKSSCSIAFPLAKKALSHYKAWKFHSVLSPHLTPQSDPISIIILRASDKTMLKLAPLAWKNGFQPHRRCQFLQRKCFQVQYSRTLTADSADSRHMPPAHQWLCRLIQSHSSTGFGYFCPCSFSRQFMEKFYETGSMQPILYFFHPKKCSFVSNIHSLLQINSLSVTKCLFSSNSVKSWSMKDVFTKWFHLQVILSQSPEDHAAAKFWA